MRDAERARNVRRLDRRCVRRRGPAPRRARRAARAARSPTTTESAAIRYAVAHGARIINLSIGGPSTSKRRARGHALRRRARRARRRRCRQRLRQRQPVEYPAALLQPVGSNGSGGSGLVVAASSRRTRRFSGSGSWISLAAPGVDIYGAFGAGATATAAARRSRRRGLRRGSARVGGEPAADGASGRADPRGDRVGARRVDARARLRHRRRRPPRSPARSAARPQTSTRSIDAPSARRRSSMRS